MWSRLQLCVSGSPKLLMHMMLSYEQPYFCLLLVVVVPTFVFVSLVLFGFVVGFCLGGHVVATVMGELWRRLP